MKLLAVFVLLASTLHTRSDAQQGFPVTASISTATPAVESGKEIRVNVSIVNKSDQTIALYKAVAYEGQAEAGDRVHVYDAHQQELSRVDGLTVHRGGVTHHLPPKWFSRTTLHVEPGKADDDFFILSKLFDLKKPGRYTVIVEAEIRHPVSESKDELLLVPSNTIEITITD